MATNGNICQTAFNDVSNNGVRKIHIQELRNALNNLDNLKGNVQNCNCAPSNCCQSATCQSCQACQSCQSGTACQSCQAAPNCNCSDCYNCWDSH